MPVKTLYPDADLAGPWQLNTPLAVDGGSTPISFIDAALAGYFGADLAAPASFDGGTEAFDIPAQAAAGDVVILITGSMDETGGTELGGGSAPTIDTSGNTFSLEFSRNIPHVGGDGETEVHVWSRVLVAGDLGNHVDVTVADHGTLDSWVAVMLVFRDVDTSTIVDATTAALQGNGAGVDWSTITPVTEGAYIVAAAFWGETGGGNIVTSVYPNDPQGMEVISYNESDSIIAPTWGSGPVPAIAFQPQEIDWGAARDYTAFQFALRPATPTSAAANLYEVVDDQTTTDYLELRAANGSLYEVLEVDLTALPAGAVVTGVRVEFSHLAAQSSRVRVFPVGINTDNSIVAVQESVVGYSPTPLASIRQQMTEEWTILGDGSTWADYTRLGIAVVQNQSPIGVSTHRVHWVRALVSYDIGGPQVSSVSGPASAGDPAEWEYANPAGRPQTHYRVMLIAGSGQDPTTATLAADPTAPATGEYFYDSGKVAGENVREFDLTGVPLIRGATTVAVQAWALTSSGSEVTSAWDTGNFNLGGAPTIAAQTDTPAFSVTAGGVEVDADPVPTGATRAWLWRSTDAGTTWTQAQGPYAVTSPGPVTLVDNFTPANETTLRYQINYDTGAASETSTAEEFPGGNVSTTIESWYFIDPEGTIPTTRPNVRTYTVERPIRAVTVDQPGQSVVATSAPLARRISLSIRCVDATARSEVQAFLDSGAKFRIVDILGRDYLVRNQTGQDIAMQRWTEPGTRAQLRDAHYIDATFVEVVQ